MSDFPIATRRKYTMAISGGKLEIESADDGRTLLSIPSDEAADILLRHGDIVEAAEFLLDQIERTPGPDGMTSNHTSGPWRISGEKSIRGPNGEYIAKTNWRNGKADAQLIAQAPDLLAERDRLREVNADLLAALDEAQLAKLMRDPRYWKQRDPEIVA